MERRAQRRRHRGVEGHAALGHRAVAGGRLELRRQRHARRHAGPSRRAPHRCRHGESGSASGVLGHRDRRRPAGRVGAVDPLRGVDACRRDVRAVLRTPVRRRGLSRRGRLQLAQPEPRPHHRGRRSGGRPERAARDPHARRVRRRHRRRCALCAMGFPRWQPGVRVRGQEPRRAPVHVRPGRAPAPERSGALR